MDGQSLNIADERLEALKSLFPDAISDGKIDFQRLKKIVADDGPNTNEHYDLTWAGKHEARREIQRQTTATLIPDRLASIGFDQSENVFIEGENLEVLRVLQRSYFGRVKMIYIDPPYNTGNDSFVYPDDYSERKDDYQRRAGLTDDNGFLNKQDLWRANRRESGQFHSAWLSMMYPRLFLARNLLREDGVIFVSIDDNEASNLKMMMDEIFGEENFMSSFIWKRRQNADNRNQNNISVDHEYIFAYCKSPTAFVGRQIDIAKYSNPDNDERGPWASIDLSGLATKESRPNLHYDIIDPETGFTYPPNPDRGWSKSQDRIKGMIKEKKILFPKRPTGRPREKKFLNEINSLVTGFSSVLDNTKVGFTTNGTKELDEIFGDRIFPFPKNSQLIKNLIEQIPDSDGIILDFFAGSATTAQAVIELNAEDGGNRKFVLVQMPEIIDETSEAYKAKYRTIADISRERIRRVINKMELTVTELTDEIALMHSDLINIAIKISELKQENPELFNDAGQSKLTQKLIADQTRIEERINEKQSRLDRLKQTPKDFRAFQLAQSNFNVWRTEATTKAEIGQLLLDYKQSDKIGADAEKMLYEFLLKKGFPLASNVEILILNGIQAYSMGVGQVW